MAHTPIGMYIVQTVVTLAAGTDTVIITKNPNRRYLSIMNVGVNPMTLAFSQAAVVGQGWGVDPGAAVGRQGGSMDWGGAGVPRNEVHAISTSGTTVVVLEGQ